MIVAVTGGTGFLGRHVVERLAAEGHRVRVLVRDRARLDPLPEGDVAIVDGDLEDPQALARLVEDASHVVHMAALVSGGGISLDAYRAVHVTATQRLVEAAARVGVRRFVHVSSVGIYGDVRGAADESTPARPQDLYEQSKWEGEEAARACAAEHGLELVVLRPAGVYGRGDRRLLKLFRGLARGRFLMIGPGRNHYHLAYVENVVDGIELALGHPAAAGEDFILADAAPVELDDLVRRIARAVGRRPPRLRVPLAPVKLAAWLCVAICRPLGISPPLYPERVAFFEKERVYSVDKARRLLGHEPRVDLDEGIARTVEAYRDDGWL